MCKILEIRIPNHFLITHTQLIVTLKSTLDQLFNSSQKNAAVNHLVHNCFKIALAYLQHRLRRGTLLDNQFGISNEDLALDCIAELFQRDEQGQFLVFEQYFAALNWQSLPEEEIKITLRRLVFSKVNEGLFSNYREEDPNLAKIIRNIKEATKKDQRVHLVKMRESSWLIVGDEDTELNPQPLAPSEILEAYLLTVVCNTSNTYRAVSSFADFIAEHPYYANGYPLSAFAQLLRASYLGRIIPEAQTEEINYEPIEVENAIQRAVAYVKNTLYDSYVAGGKLSMNLFDNYVNAVQKTLKSTFTRYAESTDSQFEALRTYMPDLSKDAYMQNHRNILQYLFKLSRTHMISYLQEEV